jgi:NAD-dependent deacetylase
MDEKIELLANWLSASTHAVALTGAGVSTESGIPDFRSADSGLWNNVDPFEIASVDGFLNNTKSFYEFWSWRFEMLSGAKPNVTHDVLSKLESSGILKSLITQNIDNLHRQAGSTNLIEVHGNYRTALCIDCDLELEIEVVFEKVVTDKIPLCDKCGGLLKPNVVLFGEMLPPEFMDGVDEIMKADFFLVLGSSLEVYPVAELVPRARMNGAKVVVINRDETPYDSHVDLVIKSELGPTMEQLADQLELNSQ